MFKPKFTITTKINKVLVEIERVRGFLARKDYSLFGSQ